MQIIRLTSLAALGLPLALAAQQPVSLTKPDAEFREPFTQISDVRELKDGRVLVTDPRDKTIQLIDFKSGTARKVGRLGAGPGEYGMPSRLIALPGDTSAIYDATNVRYLILNPDGTAGATFRLGEAATSTLGGRGVVPRATDSRGRIFIEKGPFSGTADGGLIAVDSSPVVRYDRATQKLDTLAYLQLAKGDARVAGMANGGIRFTRGMQAFPARDGWAVLADGGVAIVRVSDYHVDRYSPAGVRASGAPVKFAPVPVTDADKEAIMEAAKAMVGMSGGRGGAPSSGPTGPRPEREFPAFMPPFVASAVHARPDGELWVLRSHHQADAPVYDVFNSGGQITGRVALTAKSRVIGFGNGTVYVVRVDDDDLQFLQRYRVPPR